MSARFPLVLPHRHIRLILDRSATLLVLTRALKLDTYEVHDALTIRQNQRHKRGGRHELQDDPFVFSIEISDIQTTQLFELDLKTVRSTGHRTLEDFYLDWLSRRQQALNVDVSLYTFEILADVRYLHERVHRGYTRDPLQAPINDREPTLTADELNDLVADSHARYQADHAEELQRREAKSLANQLREATARATLRGVDVSPEMNAIRQQLDQIRNKTGAQAA